MTLDWARISLRLNRYELLAFGVLLVAFTVATILAGTWIDSLRPPPECLAQTNTPPLSCEGKVNAWYSAMGSAAGLSAGLLLFVSFAAGLFLGVPIVARELERGTARLAWTLSPSRVRWFVARLVPVLLVVGVLTFVAGVAVDRYAAAVSQSPDMANSFDTFGFRGLLVASRAIFIFAVGVLVGTVVGRALPAVIVAAVVAAIGLSGGERVHHLILATEAVAIPADMEGFGPKPGDMYIDQKFVLPDGTLVDYAYFGGEDPYDQFGNPKFPMVMLVIPGERYRFVETREALALAGGSLVALALSAFVVSRRRPG